LAVEVTDLLLVLNAGSSNLKFAAYEAAPELRLAFEGQIEGDFESASALDRIRDALGARALRGVGHRVVHGGLHYDRPMRVDDAVLHDLDALVPLAPLHQPRSLAGIRAIAAWRPELPQVACFDTAFHRTQPAVAQAFALPRELADAGLRRYGFHGLSYESVVAALPRVAPELARGRVVIAHLGNGASLCAVRDGRSVATTMGFSALDGLVMGTRCGLLDPGVLLYLMRERGMGAPALEHLLYERSGLLGVSGLSSDMRVLLASDDPRAREAVDLFVYRIGRELGSMAAALGGADALVFTGGIGEHAAGIRERVCAAAAWLGASTFVVASDENRMIASHTARVLAPS